MLLTSTQVMPTLQPQKQSSALSESSSLRRKIEELNRNTVLLITEAGKLIQGSKQLSDRLSSFESPGTKEKIR